MLPELLSKEGHQSKNGGQSICGEPQKLTELFEKGGRKRVPQSIGPSITEARKPGKEDD
jgi:hypothetical protein